MYNFISISSDENRKLVGHLEDNLLSRKNGVHRMGYGALTSKQTLGDAGGSGDADAATFKRQCHGDDRLGDQSVRESLEAVGYELTPMDGDGILIPITQVRTSHLLLERSN
jgi:hypothetical protein